MAGEFSLHVNVEGLPKILRSLRGMPREISTDVRKASKKIAQDEVVRIRVTAASHGAQAVRSASKIRARSDRVPTIKAAGSSPMFRKGVQTGQVFFGAEFGSHRGKTTRQFKPYTGHEGMWFWPTLRRDTPIMINAWMDVIDAAISRWEAGR
ncbi:hypothetical protein DUY81_08410 [Acidipropionibacterium acidipropionici]|uniref:Uncharacterized protein n=1 Tax=Acidipropionibacterium acidipropionici TaxID=1748 RepID=A0AAC8YEM8_9ACTN|nr:hypothetical protein [Acidipropionibacterium acidipropionici]AMS04667.1 hypothetical protein AXH35_03375 [Acidipropionibacterium acidipropionici]AOZ46156.1 hypothetical protein A8L58_04840 [Acidipropionibacterium acidipropionici]AZP37815.1 hypothetical protein DUY81_08410 [Acidipropionibacterium acidipropionici]